MSASPYLPPDADLRDAPLPPAASALKAVAIGVAIDIGGSFVLGIVLTVIFSMAYVQQGMDAMQIEATLLGMPWDSPFSLIGMALGTALSVLGGFMCARIARRTDYTLGFILAAISVAAAMLLGGAAYSLPVTAVLALLTVGAVLLGTWLGKARPAPG